MTFPIHSDRFHKLLELAERERGLRFIGRLLALDPGHTTGWCFFEGADLLYAGQIPTKEPEDATKNILDLYVRWQPDIVVLEDYRVYKWRAKHHAGSDLVTSRVIGCIETLAIMYATQYQRPSITVIKQPAQVAKGFCTDSKMKDWGFFQTGLKHASDAIRHACYFQLFGSVGPKGKSSSSHSVG